MSDEVRALVTPPLGTSTGSERPGAPRAPRVRHFLDAIKFEHTVFALPFAYVAMVLAADGWPGWRVARLGDARHGRARARWP